MRLTEHVTATRAQRASLAILIFVSLAAASCNKVEKHFETYAQLQIDRSGLLADACSRPEGGDSALAVAAPSESMQSALVNMFRITELQVLATEASHRAAELRAQLLIAVAVLSELQTDPKFLEELGHAHVWRSTDTLIAQLDATKAVMEAKAAATALGEEGKSVAEHSRRQLVTIFERLKSVNIDRNSLLIEAKITGDLSSIFSDDLPSFNSLINAAATLASIARSSADAIKADCDPSVVLPPRSKDIQVAEGTRWLLKANENSEKCIQALAAQVNKALHNAKLFTQGTASTSTPNAGASVTIAEVGTLKFASGIRSKETQAATTKGEALLEALTHAEQNIAIFLDQLSQFNVRAPALSAALQPLDSTRRDLHAILSSLKSEAHAIEMLALMDPKSQARTLIAQLSTHTINEHLDILLQWIIRGITVLDKRLDTLSNGSLLFGLLRTTAGAAGLDKRVAAWFAKALVKRTDKIKISRPALVSRVCALHGNLGSGVSPLVVVFLEELVLAKDPQPEEDPLLIAAVAHGLARAQIDVAEREAGVILPEHIRRALLTEAGARLIGHVDDPPRAFGAHAELTARVVVNITSLAESGNIASLDRLAELEGDLLRGLVTDRQKLNEHVLRISDQNQKTLEALASAIEKVNEKTGQFQDTLTGLDRLTRWCLAAKTSAQQGADALTCMSTVDKDNKPSVVIHFKVNGFSPCGFEINNKNQTDAIQQFAKVLKLALVGTDLKIYVRGYASTTSPRACPNTSSLSPSEKDEWAEWCRIVSDRYKTTCDRVAAGSDASKMLNEALASERARRSRDYLLSMPEAKDLAQTNLDPGARIEQVRSEVAGAANSKYNLSVVFVVK